MTCRGISSPSSMSFGNRDGPYTIEIDAEKRTMVLHMPQIRMELTLETEYRRKKKK